MSDLKLATDLASLILDLHEKTLQAAEGGPERAEEWVKLRADYTSVCSTGAAVLAAALQDLSSAERGMREASLDAVPTKDLERVIEQVLMDVCELPDRNSPDDHPEMMLVTGEELDTILKRHLGLEDRALAALSSKGEG